MRLDLGDNRIQCRILSLIYLIQAIRNTLLPML